jgi:hypothetical protein
MTSQTTSGGRPNARVSRLDSALSTLASIRAEQAQNSFASQAIYANVEGDFLVFEGRTIILRGAFRSADLSLT